MQPVTRIDGHPMPPDLLADSQPRIVPAIDLGIWARRTFALPAGPLGNPNHAHPAEAFISCLWAMVENIRKGRQVLGRCELGTPQASMGKWAKTRAEQQLVKWFGCVLRFLITIDAHYAAFRSTPPREGQPCS